MCASIPELCEQAEEGAGTLVVTEEALFSSDIQCLKAFLERQPIWSDLPLTVLIGTGGRSQEILEALIGLRNAVTLDRPVRISTLLSTVTSALKARQRQYELRDQIDRNKQTIEELARKTHQLSQSNRQLEDFAYIISHDLQSPLHKIVSFGDLLVENLGELTPQQTQYVERMKSSALKMRDLINGLLDYSRITFAKESIGTVDLNTVLTGVLADLDVRIEESNATVTSDALPVIPARDAQMHHVFLNLIDNALKYRSTEAPRIHISAEWTGTQWKISVADNGLGIDAASTERIFNLFQRLHTNNVSGMGIGLAICKKIIQDMGGEISVQSEPGKGSTFSFTVPALERSASTPSASAVPTSRSA
jgi:light-regulated signal transduction histidine kinase (bacteriophytochrome)